MIAISKNKRAQIIVRETGGIKPADVYLQLEVELADSPLEVEIEPPLIVTVCQQE
jgi:hypothetical protein